MLIALTLLSPSIYGLFGVNSASLISILESHIITFGVLSTLILLVISMNGIVMSKYNSEKIAILIALKNTMSVNKILNMPSL